MLKTAHPRNEQCLELAIEHLFPQTVCLVTTIGDPDDLGSICDQVFTCHMVFPSPDTLPIAYGNTAYICWDDHRGAYHWHDTIIYSSCVDPPCRTITKSSAGCCVDSVKPIVLMSGAPNDAVKQVVFCDEDEFPYITEDRTLYVGEACGDQIIWNDKTKRGCDTSYLFYLEVFHPSPSWEIKCDSWLRPIVYWFYTGIPTGLFFGHL